MKNFSRLLVLTLSLGFAAGTLAYAADPTPTPPASTDDKTNPGPQPWLGGPQ